MKNSISQTFCGLIFFVAFSVMMIVVMADFPEGLRDLFIEAATTTVKISISSISLGFILALLFTFAPNNTVFGITIRIIIHLSRSTPMVCALLIIYWIPPVFGVYISSENCATITISVIEGSSLAYIMHNIKIDLQTKFVDSCFTLGFSKIIAFIRVIVPLTMIVSIPHFYNFILFNINAAALSSFIGVVDVTQAARIFSTTLVDPALSYGLLFIFYMCVSCLTFILARGAEILTGWSDIIQESGTSYE